MSSYQPRPSEILCRLPRGVHREAGVDLSIIVKGRPSFVHEPPKGHMGKVTDPEYPDDGCARQRNQQGAPGDSSGPRGQAPVPPGTLRTCPTTPANQMIVRRSRLFRSRGTRPGGHQHLAEHRDRDQRGDQQECRHDERSAQAYLFHFTGRCLGQHGGRSQRMEDAAKQRNAHRASPSARHFRPPATPV